ncbi:MAG: hypothetical protein AAGE96_06355 [Cyanobacteria bacterium P01_G01_bin.19]
MVTDKVRGTYDIAALDKTESDIWKKLTIIKTEAWFDTVQAIAMEHQVRAKLESRYMKSAIICDAKGRRIGRIWHWDDEQPICYDINNWRSHFEMANTITSAVEKIAKIII